jgi:enterochelin esterase-like enzyme
MKANAIPVSLFFLIAFSFAEAQDYSVLRSTMAQLRSFVALGDTTIKKQQISTWWTKLEKANQIPLIDGDSVIFLYQGKAHSVDWMGDFNGWGYDKKFNNKGVAIAGTDIWMLKTSFPKDARLDYKIFVDGNRWMIDPANPVQQWSGVGGGSPNSALRMPNWKEDPLLTPRENIPHGKVESDLLFNSAMLGYQITYSVYQPAGLDQKNASLETLYVTDGYEYMHPKLGNMITILDNLLADGKIRPLIVVFIDHREPVNRSNNKRMDELAMNPRYLDFFEHEFIPMIESRFLVQPRSSARAIMGSSMGGLNAAYFAFSKPGIFGMAGIQSPAFWIRPQIYTLCNNPNQPIKVSMTSGMISDASEGSRKMKDILQANACEYHYREVNDGHSWGNWRNLIGDILIDLFGK